ncbi:hypothetical protein B484DRAFT_433737 [Ochromonadaceae sp. CCMP2298]|nr:hypothetical protein B484DRAFT_433737 [Ochromonadaceae sp. CCMP2298]
MHWWCFPLLRAESVDADLLPLHSNDAEAMWVDSHVRIIPLLVLDEREEARLKLNLDEITAFTPVLVLNELWFRTNYAVYREGMEGVFRITQSFRGASASQGGLASFLSEAAFPLGSRRAQLFTKPKTAFDVARLLEGDEQDKLLSAVRFRCCLADAFSAVVFGHVVFCESLAVQHQKPSR